MTDADVVLGLAGGLGGGLELDQGLAHEACARLGTQLGLSAEEAALATAEQALIQARYDYRIARAQLEALIGRDLQ